MKSRCPFIVSGLAFACWIVSGSSALTIAQEGEQGNPLMKILRNAKPAPIPPGISYSAAVSASESQRGIVRLDLVTGEEVVMPGWGPPAASSIPANLPFDPQQVPEAVTMEILDNPEDIVPKAITPTPPSPVLGTTTFPFNTIYKLLMRFEVSETDYYYVCSAASMGSFHLLTAGHCIYNHDPNGDGNVSDSGFAAEVWAWPGQTDRVNPSGDPDFPYGVAKSTALYTYNGWINSSRDLNNDMGYIALDRRIGDRTGWMGRETTPQTSSLNFSGYPAETPYVPAGNLLQYFGYDSGNVREYTEYRIQLDAFVYGGHSGGPEWRLSGEDYYIQGVNSTSNRVGFAEGTYLTTDKRGDIDFIVSDDETARPPTPRPELIEYVKSTDAKNLLNNSAPQGGTIQVEYNVYNVGFVGSGALTVDFYLSTNTNITTSDTLIERHVLSTLNADAHINPTTTLTVPFTQPTGIYYVGWIFSSGAAEYNTDNNTVVIANETLDVQPGCTVDGWEPDNAAGTANTILAGVPQTHSICGLKDEDWIRFNLIETSEVNLATSGPSGDTRMWLKDSSFATIDYNENGGTGSFSLVQRVCGVNALPAGNYYVQIDESGDNDFIPSYDITFTASACLPSTTDTTGVFRPTNGLIYLKSTNTTGLADTELVLGVPGDLPVAGDWDGDGVDSIGVYRNGVFYLRNSNTSGFADMTFAFGQSGDLPVAGDWNGNGVDTVGIYRDGQFMLRNSNSSGSPDIIFALGIPGDEPIAGDWDGDGDDSTGVFRPTNGQLYLKNENTTGFADIEIVFGTPNDKPTAGDWDGDGIDTIGVYRDGLFLLRNTNTAGFADAQFALGVNGDLPITGKWGTLP